MDRTEIIKTIDRVRRDFPRHQVVLSLCDACESLMSKGTKRALTRAEIQRNYRERKKALRSMQ